MLEKFGILWASDVHCSRGSIQFRISLSWSAKNGLNRGAVWIDHQTKINYSITDILNGSGRKFDKHQTSKKWAPEELHFIMEYTRKGQGNPRAETCLTSSFSLLSNISLVACFESFGTIIHIHIIILMKYEPPPPPIYRLLSGGKWIERSLSTSSKEGYYSLSGSRSKWGGCRQSWAASTPHLHPRCQRRRPPPKWKQWNYIVDPNTLLTGDDWRPSQAHRFLSPTSPWIPTSLAYDENGCIRTLHPGLWLMWWTQRSSLYVLQLDIVTAWGEK